MKDVIDFAKPGIVLSEWLKESKMQIKRLKNYKTKEMQVFRGMRYNLLQKAINAIKESEYVKFYGKLKTSTERRKFRKEAVDILTYLCLQEIQLDRDFELYRRGSIKYRQKVEEKWLKNSVNAHIG